MKNKYILSCPIHHELVDVTDLNSLQDDRWPDLWRVVVTDLRTGENQPLIGMINQKVPEILLWLDEYMIRTDDNTRQMMAWYNYIPLSSPMAQYFKKSWLRHRDGAFPAIAGREDGHWRICKRIVERNAGVEPRYRDAKDCPNCGSKRSLITYEVNGVKQTSNFCICR